MILKWRHRYPENQVAFGIHGQAVFRTGNLEHYDRVTLVCILPFSIGRCWPVRPSLACLSGQTGEAARQDGTKKLLQPKTSVKPLSPLILLSRIEYLNGSGKALLENSFPLKLPVQPEEFCTGWSSPFLLARSWRSRLLYDGNQCFRWRLFMKSCWSTIRVSFCLHLLTCGFQEAFRRGTCKRFSFAADLSIPASEFRSYESS